MFQSIVFRAAIIGVAAFTTGAAFSALLLVTSAVSAQDKPADKPNDKPAAKPALAQPPGETWTTQLVGRIRAATQANPTNESGIAKVRFTLDRSGQVVQSSVAESSGSTALDLEAIAIVTRAAPFPSPPDTKTSDLTFVVPIRFTARLGGGRAGVRHPAVVARKRSSALAAGRAGPAISEIPGMTIRGRTNRFVAPRLVRPLVSHGSDAPLSLVGTCWQHQCAAPRET